MKPEQTESGRQGVMDLLSIIKFLAVLLTGCLLKKLQILKVSDIRALSSVMIYITLPCALAAGTQGLQPEGPLLFLALISFVSGALMMLIGRFASRDPEEQALLMVHLSSLNIGGFAVPFVQSGLPAGAVAFSGLYDIGNSCYGNGASYLIPKALREGGGGVPVGQIFKKLCRSVPLMTYLAFLVLAFAGIRLPDPVFQLLRDVGNCNFLIVFLIAGIAMDLHVDRSGLKTVFKFILLKYGCGAALACAVYFLLPFDLAVRQAVIFCIFAPQASTSVAYSELLGCNSKVYSTMYTAGIAASLFAYLILNMMWGL